MNFDTPNFQRENQELKKHLIHLNDVLQTTKKLCNGLQKKNESLEIQNRTLEEDFNTYKDNHESLKKRYDQLQKELVETKNNMKKKYSMFDFFTGSGVKDENSKLREIITTLENELTLKIQENEQCHIDMFEIKQSFDEKVSKLETEIEKMRMMISDKNNEINIINDKHSSLATQSRQLESNLNNLTETLKKVENEYKEKFERWKKKKEKLNASLQSKEKIERNLLSINEYKNFDLNGYNLEFLNDDELFDRLALGQFKYASSILNSIVQFVSNGVDQLLDSLIERYNFFYSNIDLKNEHRGFLFTCDKVRFHLFSLQQLLRTSSLFAKLLHKNLEMLINFNSSLSLSLSLSYKTPANVRNFILNLSILLTLLNRSCVVFELIAKYLKFMFKEERRVSYFDYLDDYLGETGKSGKLNKDLKNQLTYLCSVIKLIFKKLNLIFNFDIEYSIKNIHIISDNSSGILIRVNESYFKNFKFNSNMKNRHRINLIETLIKTDISVSLKNALCEIFRLYEIKLDTESKLFEIIKEENKNKYNYPIINLTALKLNNENCKKNLKQISESLGKVLLNLDVGLFGNYFKIRSWEFHNSQQLVNCIGLIMTKCAWEKTCMESLMKELNKREPGVDYREAVRNREILKEMLEKENMVSRDRDNYISKASEYEESMKRFTEKLNEEQNLNDLLKMKLIALENQIKTGTISSEDISDKGNLNLYTHSLSIDTENEFHQFIHRQKDITQIEYEILSDDVQAGKQRSTFKLEGFDKTIPLSKFTNQVDTSQDVSILYHRKVLEKIQRYSSKVKGIDIKVLANIHADEIITEYESKIKNEVGRYEKEISELREQVRQRDDAVDGFVQQINYLSESMTILDDLKNNIKDCQRCKRFIR